MREGSFIIVSAFNGSQFDIISSSSEKKFKPVQNMNFLLFYIYRCVCVCIYIFPQYFKDFSYMTSHNVFLDQNLNPSMFKLSILLKDMLTYKTRITIEQFDYKQNVHVMTYLIICASEKLHARWLDFLQK